MKAEEKLVGIGDKGDLEDITRTNRVNTRNFKARARESRIGADKSAKGPRNFQGREDVSRIKPSTKGSKKEEALEGREALIA